MPANRPLQAAIEPLEDRRLFAVSASPIDPTFGNTGQTTVQFSGRKIDNFFASAVQPDGKILIAGSMNTPEGTDLALARLNPDATVDTSFGFMPDFTPGGGLFTLQLDTNTDTLFDIALQPDGKIIVVGSIGQVNSSLGVAVGQAVVARLDTNGIPDTTFGDSGLVFLPLSTNSQGLANSEARGVALQSDGKIIIAGTADIEPSTGTAGFAAARLNIDGSLDTSFGGNGTGIRVETQTGFQSILLGVAVDKSDRILLTGSVIIPASTTGSIPAGVFLTARLNPNGSDDLSFGDQGAVAGNFPANGLQAVLPIGTRVAVQDDGKIVTTGSIVRVDLLDGTTTVGVALVRYNDDGSPDTSFGVDGQTETYFGPADDNDAYVLPTDVTLLPNGRILVVGRASIPQDDPNNFNSVAVIRYTSTGKVDRTFNRTGKLLITPTGTLTPQSARKAAPASTGFNNAALSAAASAAVSPGAGIYLIAENQDLVNVTLLRGDGADLVTTVQPFKNPTLLTGSKTTISLKLANQGNLPLKSTITLDLKLATSTTPSANDKPLGQITVPVSLKNGLLRVVTFTLNLPPEVAPAGTYFLLVQANANKAANEANYLNNTSVSPTQLILTQGFIDLAPTSITAPASLRIGRNASITLKLANTGNLPATGSILLQLFASVDDTQSNDDLVLLQPKTVKVNLKATTGVVTLRLPASASPGSLAGNYLLLVKLDSSSLPTSRTPNQIFNLNRSISLA
jgi:uncharacterized delta-60 repeat protein